MRRRSFATGALALAAPFAARAQGQPKPARIAWIQAATAQLDVRRGPFLEAMRGLGYVEGRNVTYELRYYGDDLAAMRQYMNDLVRERVDIIVTNGTTAGLAARAATSTIPVVLYTIPDPVAVGLAASMARPGGNVTGFTFNVEGSGDAAKRIELLKEFMPGLRRVGLLRYPDNAGTAISMQAMGEVARALGMTATVFEARRAEDFERAFAAMGEASIEAVATDDDITFNANRVAIIAQATPRGLPVVCGTREFVQAGCLFSYAVDVRDNARRAAGYVDRILKGAKPGDLPFQQPIKFEFLINGKTAKALGLEIPLLVLAQADEVIE